MNLQTHTLNTTSTILHALGINQYTEQEHVISKEQFIKFRDAFKELAHNKQITSKDIILYNTIRGVSLSRGFTDVTNKVKLANGQYPKQAFNIALSMLKFHLSLDPTKISARFDNFVFMDEEALKRIKEILKNNVVNTYLIKGIK